MYLCFLQNRQDPDKSDFYCAVSSRDVHSFKNPCYFAAAPTGLCYLFLTGRPMGILYHTNFKFFLPEGARTKIEFSSCSYTGSLSNGNISDVELYKRPVRLDGYCLFNWFLAAGFILYEN